MVTAVDGIDKQLVRKGNFNNWKGYQEDNRTKSVQ